MTDVLYHYTHRYNLSKIFKSGYLKLTESNLKAPLDLKDAMPKPDYLLRRPVVWLTRSTTGSMSGLEGCSADKREIRFVLQKRNTYEPWLIWSRQNRIKSSWAKCLERSGNPYEWYISEKIIPLNTDEVIRVENTVTGETLIDTTQGINSYQVKVTRPAGMPKGIFEKFMAGSDLEEGEAFEFVMNPSQ